MSPPIAIVGVSVELPSGSYSTKNLDHKAFFDFLLASGEAYETLPVERFNIEAWKGSGVGKVHVDKGSFLKEIDMFDNVEFGISSKDAQSMSPAARKLLENSFLALLDSGIDYRKKNIGVFTSGTSIDLMNVSEPDEFDARGSFAGYPSMIANRISNHLDLLGPSLPLDTACSSTLTAMHLAVQAISNGDCEAAVVGGCQLNHRFIDWITYSQGSLLAKDGKCKPFDSHADGFARAEGCAVVVVKPLDAALKDQDHIYATILGTAINSTGSAAAPGAPVAESQRDAMKQAFERAGKSPREVDYVELHATGTAKGDPTEANWVGDSFHREDELLVGSVKGNIGHTEITAFLASLSKVISIFDKKVIPPQVNIRELNPAIKWEEYRLRVPLEATPLPCRSNTTSLVSIAGSGIGGSNGHVVLQSPPPIVSVPKVKDDRTSRPTLVMAGGLSSRAAVALSQSIQKAFSGFAADLPGLSTVLGRRSKQTTWRAYTIAGVDHKSLHDFSAPQHSARNTNSLIYLFSGQGPQHKDMGRELFQAYPAFRESVLEMDAVFEKVTGKSMVQEFGLFGGITSEPLPEIWPIALVLPSIAIFQIALFDLLKSLGMTPDVVMGHSAGETAVLYASGAAPKAMAVELAIIRGRSFTPIEKLGGTMAAISCSPEEFEELLSEHRKLNTNSIVELACFNAPSAVAIAGEEVAIDDIVRLAEARGRFARKIRTRVPFHSSMMEDAKATYTASLRDLFERYPGPHFPQTPVCSTLTGELFQGSFDANYFWDNTVSPVKFTQAMSTIRRSFSNASFVEIAPHPVLSSYLVSMASESSTVVHSVQRPKRASPPTEYVDILHLCGKLTVAGHNCIDFTVLNNRACSEVDLALPAYPFSKKKYALYPDTPGVHKQMEVPRGPLNYSYLKMNKETHPMLAEHIIRGEPIMPAAGFLETALEFGASTLMNVNLRSILSLSSEKPVKVNVQLDGAFWTIKSLATSKSRKDGVIPSVERLHADGYLSFETPSIVAPLDIALIRSRCDDHIGSGFYPSLSYFSAYGPPFQRVTNLFFNQQEALASIKGMDATLAADGKYLLHPAILDACIQVTAYKPFHGDYDPNIYYLPAHVDAVVVHQALKPGYFPAHIYAHVELKKWVPDAMHYDISLVDDSGVRLCTFVGLQVAKHRINPLTDTTQPFELTMQPVFHDARTTKVLQDSRDRSDLFGTLDKMTIRAKMRSKTGASQPVGAKLPVFGMNPEWMAYLDTLDATDTISPCDGPQFDEAIKCNMQSLRRCLTSLAEAGVQVIRSLIVTNVKSDSFCMSLEEIIREFPSMYMDLSVDNKHPSQSQPKVTSGMVRNIKTDFTPSGLHGLEDQLFDILFFFNVTGGEATPQSIASAAHRHLVPGGTLIMTERNVDAWEMGALGTMWYNATFGTPSTADTHTVDSYLDCLKGQNVQTIQLFKSEDADPFHFSLESQKKPWSVKDTPESPLFDSSESFVFGYKYGSELDLQWELSGLNEAQSLDIWVTATEGKDGGAAQGVVRALRREYISWTIRLVVFPASYDDDLREEFLEHLPLELHDERDIVVSTERPNCPLVPRLAPVCNLPIDHLGGSKWEGSTTITPNHVRLRPLSASQQGDIFGILATVVDGNSTEFQAGSFVAGLYDASVEDSSVLDISTLASVPVELLQHAAIISSLLPGFITTILAIGLSTLSRPSRLRALRILLTHSDTAIGTGVIELSSQHGVHLHCLSQSASLSDLAKLQYEPFDLIISGYTEKSYLQVMATLLRPGSGRAYLWNDKENGLTGVLKKDPYSVGDALRLALSAMSPRLIGISLPKTVAATEPGLEVVQKIAAGSLAGSSSFNKAKTHIILGGIGTIGAHLALFMYQRGARHIILTSRSGKKSLESNTNVVVRRMFSYLETREDLRISFRALDGTDKPGMKALMTEIGPSHIGGCIILSAVLLDGIFRHLTESDFSRVFAAKLGVLEAVKESIDMNTMDFVVSFTSVSGLIGFGGQTNYGAANTALEYEMSQTSNGFAFICPGVLDSTLMFAGTGKLNETRLSALTPWSLSAEDMMRWFDDAMFRFQNGQRIVRYVPDLDWEALDKNQGMPRLGKHLLPSQTVEAHTAVDDTERMTGIIKGVLAIPAADFSADVPLTAYGIDSLSASRISFLLRPFVEVSQIQLLADLTFNDIHQLSLVDVPTTTGAVQSSEPKATRSKAGLMTDMLAKYSSEMSTDTSIRTDGIESSIQDEAVLITGTTGTLGSNILSHLLQNDEVKIVYAFNRVSTTKGPSLERQRSSFVRQGLPVSLLDSPKLVMLDGDLTADDFALSSTTIRQLRSSVTHIIHNAWAVDFVTSLTDHEDLIKGTRKLLDFAQQSTLSSSPSLSYISTIGIFQSSKEASYGSSGPEAPVTDPKIAIQTGYIESKWVAERLFQLAGEKCGLRTNVIRVGLLTGGLNGSWDPSQWLPGIAQSAAYLGCLPESEDIISWIPVDMAAAAIVDMRQTPNETLHLIHPKPTTWNALMRPLSKILNVPLVPYVEWFARLESSARDADSDSPDMLNKRAALRLTHFYRIGLNASPGNTESRGLLPIVASKKGLDASSTLRTESLTPLNEQDVEKWVSYWREIGFLPS